MSFTEKESPALDSISAEFISGQMVGLVGPDGAGKTTLMRLISGLLVPTKGKILDRWARCDKRCRKSA